MEKLRLALLTITFSSVFCIFVKTILSPPPDKFPPTPFIFPTAVPLPEWQFKTSDSLAPSSKNSSYFAAKHYQYTRNDQTLDIKMWYVLNTNGDIQSFIHNYFSKPQPANRVSLVLHQQPGIGYSALFTHQRQAYLSSCINSHGNSTATVPQFRHNRYTYDLFDLRLKERIIPWLQGQVSVLDNRCIWVSLSVSAQNASLETKYQILKKAWSSWYQWWSPRFPQP